jgi:hypothetical protein
VSKDLLDRTASAASLFIAISFIGHPTNNEATDEPRRYKRCLEDHRLGLRRPPVDDAGKEQAYDAPDDSFGHEKELKQIHGASCGLT